MAAKTRPYRRIKYAAPVAIAVAVIAGIGVAVAATNSGPTDPTDTFNQHTGEPVTYATATAPAGGNLAPATAAQQVLQGLGSANSIKSITVSPGTYGSAVTVNLNRNNEGADTQWLSELAVGALGELTRTTQATIGDEYFSATAVGPNSVGVSTTTGLGVGAATLGQKFDSPSDAALASRVDDVAVKFGLTVGSLQILHPLESAIQVTLVVPTGAKIDWTIDQLRTALVGSTPDVEGAFIELVSPAGEPLLRAGTSYRTANGILWFAPGQDERFGAIHGGLDSSK